MKKHFNSNFFVLCIAFWVITQPSFSQIIADHTIVDEFDDIPQQWIDSVKTMWLVIAGESHSAAYRDGLARLEELYPAYAVSVRESGTPDPYTTENLRVSRATWGDLEHETGWRYGYGEEDWFTSETAMNRTKAGISYCNSHGLTIGAFGLGWCWDPEILDFTDYINATRSYIDYCADSIQTKIIFTTGTVDSYTGETGYLKHLGYESIRDSVKKHPDWILFDYADILCYDNNGRDSIVSWNGHQYRVIASDNMEGDETGHIGMNGALRLAKAMWWMLARTKGWGGITTDIKQKDNDSQLSDQFSLSQNFPNPFNSITNITYSVKTPCHISLEIFDFLGREVATLVNEAKSPGEYTVEWDGTDSAGHKVGSGVYFYRLKCKPGFSDTMKMILLN